jgi:ribosomal protein S18 acetylase RimI-like enzyme
MLAMEHPNKELCQAIDDSFIDVFAAFCTATPNAVLQIKGDAILYASGFSSSLLNGVLGAKFSAETMAKRVREVLAYFEKRKLPMTFFVGPGCTPHDLDDFLQRQGLVPGWSRPGMAMDLGDIEPRKLPTGLEIRPVENMVSLGVCADTFARGFGTDMASVEWLRTLVMGYGISDTRRWFLGYLDGKPMASSLLVLHRGLAGIYCVATLQEARGRGIGAALTREPMLIAKNLGYDFAILQSSKMGLPVYERLGFKEYCRIRAYIWMPK